MSRFLSRLLWWTCVSVWIDVGVSEFKVKFGVLLPEKSVERTMDPCTTLARAMAEEWSITQDLASLNWAVDSPASSKSSTRGLRTSNTAISFQFDYSNSQCSDMYGPVRAMELYYRGAGCRADEGSKAESGKPLDIRVFFGPCCKYALAPVVRNAKVWNVPVITPGGLTSRFSSSDDFSMLTRFIAPYMKVAEFLPMLLSKYGWRHIYLLFHDNLGLDKMKGYPMCYDLMEAIGRVLRPQLKMISKLTVDDTAGNGTTSDNGEQEDSGYVINRNIFNENDYNIEDFDEYLANIRNVSRGKYP